MKTSLVMFDRITATINHVLSYMYLRTQLKYMIFHIYSPVFFTINGYVIINSQSDQLWPEHCTQVMGSNPVQAWIFFQVLIS